MSKYLIALFVIFFAGCAASQPCSSLKFQKDGTTPDDFKKAAYDCENDPQIISAEPKSCGFGDIYQKQRALYIRCMESKGWHLTESPH
jgi:hypothetical protein